MKFNKYILLLIAFCTIMIIFSILRSRKTYDPILEGGIRPGLPNSHVTLGRPMRVA